MQPKHSTKIIPKLLIIIRKYQKKISPTDCLSISKLISKTCKMTHLIEAMDNLVVIGLGELRATMSNFKFPENHRHFC